MSNPVAVLRTLTYQDEWVYKTVYVWCQACDQIHPFRVELNKSAPTHSQHANLPVWDWNGSLTSPTFSPSLLVYHTVDICEPGWKHYELCEFGEDCETPYHAIVWRRDPDGPLESVKVSDNVPEDAKLLAHRLPCQRPHGSCHTFLRDGVWEYLGDCAHNMRGLHPLQPLPNWFLGEEEDDE